MKKLFSTSQIIEADNFAIEILKIPSIILMENAAKSAYKVIIENFLKNFNEDDYEITIVCGKGNNGGDGFALARHLSLKAFKVKVIYISDENLSPEAAINLKILFEISKNITNLKIEKFENLRQLESSSKYPIYVDAILGSGSKLPLKEPLNEIITKLNSLRGIKIAIDIPTGLDSDNGWAEIAFKANMTICLGNYKKGLFVNKARDYCGQIVKGDIGIGDLYFNNLETSCYLIEQKDIADLLPVKEKTQHKYSSGKVAIIAGSKNYFGAAILCAKACQKSGAGAIILYVPESLKIFYQQALPELVIKSYPDSNQGILTLTAVPYLIKEMQNKYDAIAFGSGIGREEETIQAAENLLRDIQKFNLVLDADALYAISQIGIDKFEFSNTIFTPHLKEFSLLINKNIEEIERNYFESGFDFVEKTKSVLILKGAPSVIFNKNKKSYVLPNGNPGMAKFGSGDVLTGLLAGILAQFKNNDEHKTFKAAITASYIHNLAGDLCAKYLTEYAYYSNTLISFLPVAFSRIIKLREENCCR